HLHEILNCRLISFADQNRITWIAVDERANFSQNLVYFRQIVRVFVLNIGVAKSVLSGKNWIIVQVGVFEETGNRVHAEGRGAAGQAGAENSVRSEEA